MSDVFISYSRLDKDFVGQLREALAQLGQDVWIDWEDIPPSQSWWSEIQKGISHANNFVVVISPNSLSSPICHLEIEYARQLKKRIIPVYYKDYKRDDCLKSIDQRLEKEGESVTRDLWGTRSIETMFDSNDAELKRINYFFFKADADFKPRFAELFKIIRTDYDHKEQHTRLDLRAQEWQRRSEDASFLLLDSELAQAQQWLKVAAGKEPPPTTLHQRYIEASEKRTQRLRLIRRASIMGTAAAVVATLFALGGTLVGLQASADASSASTQVVQVLDQANAAATRLEDANAQLVTATHVANQAANAEQTLISVNTQVSEAAATVTRAAIESDMLLGFSNALIAPDEATRLLTMDQLVARYPDEASVHLFRGMVHFDNKNYDQALADYDEALRLFPNYPSVYVNRGNVYLQLQNYEAAIDNYTAALSLDPNDVAAYTNRATAYYVLGNDEASLADFETLLALDPTYINAYINRSDVYLALGDYDKALADLDVAQMLNDQDVDVYSFRSTVYEAMGDYEKAIDTINTALDLDPQNAMLYQSRSSFHALNGDYEQAFADIDMALRLKPNEAEFYYFKAALYHETGDYEAGLEMMNQTLRLNPEKAEAYVDRGELLYLLGEIQPALDDLAEGMRLMPDRYEFYALRCEIYLSEEQWSAAVADCDQASALGAEFDEATLEIIALAREQSLVPTARP